MTSPLELADDIKPEWCTVQQAGRAIGKCDESVRRLVRLKELGAYRTGKRGRLYISRTELQQYIERNKV